MPAASLRRASCCAKKSTPNPAASSFIRITSPTRGASCKPIGAPRSCFIGITATPSPCRRAGREAFGCGKRRLFSIETVAKSPGRVGQRAKPTHRVARGARRRGGGSRAALRYPLWRSRYTGTGWGFRAGAEAGALGRVSAARRSGRAVGRGRIPDTRPGALDPAARRAAGSNHLDGDPPAALRIVPARGILLR